MTTRHVIHVQRRKTSFDDLQVLRGTGCDAAPGRIFALLGSNATGKTTIVRIETRAAADP